MKKRWDQDFKRREEFFLKKINLNNLIPPTKDFSRLIYPIYSFTDCMLIEQLLWSWYYDAPGGMQEKKICSLPLRNLQIN